MVVKRICLLEKDQQVRRFRDIHGQLGAIAKLTMPITCMMSRTPSAHERMDSFN